jgi:mannose-6-phosphate isomerase-like protein (cupin superfamily)
VVETGLVADFAIANLLSDVENSAEKFGFAPTLEARFAKTALDSKKLSVSYQKIAPNEQSPFAHRHKEQAEELYVVVEGSGRVHLGDDVRDVGKWDVVRVAAPVVRSFEAAADGLTVLAFGETNPSNDAELVYPDDAA